MGDGDSELSHQQSLEQALLRRQMSPPTKTSWEREMVRGYVHCFDKYKLAMTNSIGVEEIVVIQEDAAMIATRVWDCAVLTSKWLEQISLNEKGMPDLATALELKVKPSLDRPIQVLELGAGTGLLSICLAKMGVAVLSTEYGTVVNYLEDNCRSNGVLPDASKTLIAGMVTCRALDWYNANETLETLFSIGEEAIFDIVIVTDCSLTERDTRGVFRMINKYSTEGHTRVIVGSCHEREGTPLVLERVNDFRNVRKVEQSELHPDYKSSRHIILLFDV